MASITGANAVIMLWVPNLFPIPTQLQFFATDDVYETDPLQSAEVQMGVDGHLSAGWVAVPVEQRYALQADSPSVAFFDSVWAASQQVRDVYFIQGQVKLPNLGKKWVQTNGILSDYKPQPDVKKLLQAQKFRITWESTLPMQG
jgi:hypothetical protein